MWGFKRKDKEPQKIILEHRTLNVTHTIRKEPEPRPTRLWITFRNDVGELWQGAPNYIHGRKVMLYPVPMSWLTGDSQDYRQIQMELNLEYD